MESPAVVNKDATNQQLEVTGVSRSGRVRKKSSKLMDFQSIDEIEAKIRRTTPKLLQTKISAQLRDDSMTTTTATTTTTTTIPQQQQQKPPTTNITQQQLVLPPPLLCSTSSPPAKSESRIIDVQGMEINNEEIGGGVGGGVDGGNGSGGGDVGHSFFLTNQSTSQNMQIHSLETNTNNKISGSGHLSANNMDDNDDDDDDSESGALLIVDLDTTVRKSAYMTEKSTLKRKIYKGGKIRPTIKSTGGGSGGGGIATAGSSATKTQRKDKGKSRFTAYMLWAKDKRQEMLANQEFDFSSISKRLGEMWANVPNNEKYNWRRRAKRLAMKGKKEKNTSGKHGGDMVGGGDGGSSKKNAEIRSSKIKSKFLNKGIGKRLGGGDSSSGKAKKPKSSIKSIKTNSSSKTKKSSKNHQHGASTGQLKSNSNTSSHHNKSSSNNTSTTSSNNNNNNNGLKMSGTAPMDVAAHLKLLGDSLTIIGERLKEHEGQITVSGSLSVLLDSLLCSVGPLMCLSTCIPIIGPQLMPLKEQMANTLDNIAYVMPGL